MTSAIIPERSRLLDEANIRAIVDGWIMWRDGAAWDKLLAAWHPGGRMSSTRFEGAAADFVEQTRRAYEAGARVRHAQSGFRCEISGDRAFAVTGMTITQRGDLDDVPIDIVCTGCFVDFLSFRAGRWALDRRQPAYDWDRVDAVNPGTALVFDETLLAEFPRAYRYLAYLQHRAGHAINLDLPEARGPSWKALMAEASAWLNESDVLRDLPSPRRVVVGEVEGRSVVLHDEALGPGRTPVEGLHTRAIWATDAAADYRTPLDRVPWPAGIAPPAGGTRFSILDIAPGHRGAHLHCTDTMDYVLCLAGAVEILLDDGAVTLRAGDVAIQCGTNHGWANTGADVARVAVILVDGQPKRSGSIAGQEMAP